MDGVIEQDTAKKELSRLRIENVELRSNILALENELAELKDRINNGVRVYAVNASGRIVAESDRHKDWCNATLLLDEQGGE